jgi:hypothetical protein
MPGMWSTFGFAHRRHAVAKRKQRQAQIEPAAARDDGGTVDARRKTVKQGYGKVDPVAGITLGSPGRCRFALGDRPADGVHHS